MSHGRSIDTTKILNKLCKYDYVSFDIFDTLIKRDVVFPTEVFCLTEREYNRRHEAKICAFDKVRIGAEKQARQNSAYKEITLAEIYKKLPYEEEVCRELKEIECELERKVCVPNLPLVTIFHQLRQAGKSLYLVSDIYLPRETITGILEKCGIFGYKALYLSSEYRCQKLSGLYRVFLDKEGLTKTRVIHVGDTFRSDGLSVMLQDMGHGRPLLIPGKIEQFPYKVGDCKDDPCSTDILNSFINNHLDSEKDYYYRVGFALYGPMLYEFSKWLAQRVEQEQINQILFLARDSYVIKKAFDTVYQGPAEGTYCYLSRTSILGTRLCGDYSVQNVMQKVGMRVSSSLEVFLKHIEAYTPENKAIADDMKVDLEAPFTQVKDRANVQEFLKKVVIKAKPVFVEKDTLFARYLQQIWNQGKKIAVVDVGWNGTAQKAIENAMQHQGIAAEVYGYYLGINKKKDREKCITIDGFLVNDTTSQEQWAKMKAIMGFLEFFLTAPHGTTLGYQEKSGKVVPILGEYEYAGSGAESTKEAEVIRSLQTGALDFVGTFAKSELSAYISPVCKEVMAPLFQLCIKPTTKDLHRFGDILFFDADLAPMAKPKPLHYYLKNPHALRSDFGRSSWKPGFIRRLFFNLPLPYFTIYKFLLERFGR